MQFDTVMQVFEKMSIKKKFWLMRMRVFLKH